MHVQDGVWHYLRYGEGGEAALLQNNMRQEADLQRGNVWRSRGSIRDQAGCV